MTATTIIVPEVRSLGASLVTSTGPTAWPVSLVEAKAQCRITSSAEDDFLNALIYAATATVENDTRLRLITQTVDQAIDRFPAGGAPLPFYAAPLQSVSLITSYASDDTSSAFSSSNYFLDTSRVPGRICLKQNCSWPDDQRSAVAGVVRAVVGFGAASSAVPTPLIHAVKLLISHWNEHREAAWAGDVREVPLAYRALIGPWIVHYVGDDD